MKQHHYTFISVWHLQAPLEKVWEYLFHIEKWPSWWKGVKCVEVVKIDLASGGIGSTFKSTWKSWLPYSINFTLVVTEVVPGKMLKASAKGDLDGTGTWEFTEANGETTATYTWDVSTTKPWMNFLAPVAKPFFTHAHNTVMDWGEQGLKKELGLRD